MIQMTLQGLYAYIGELYVESRGFMGEAEDQRARGDALQKELDSRPPAPTEAPDAEPTDGNTAEPRPKRTRARKPTG